VVWYGQEKGEKVNGVTNGVTNRVTKCDKKKALKMG
jgi:hypothetical protein